MFKKIFTIGISLLLISCKCAEYNIEIIDENGQPVQDAYLINEFSSTPLYHDMTLRNVCNGHAKKVDSNGKIKFVTGQGVANNIFAYKKGCIPTLLSSKNGKVLLFSDKYKAYEYEESPEKFFQESNSDYHQYITSNHKEFFMNKKDNILGHFRDKNGTPIMIGFSFHNKQFEELLNKYPDKDVREIVEIMKVHLPKKYTKNSTLKNTLRIGY